MTRHPQKIACLGYCTLYYGYMTSYCRSLLEVQHNNVQDPLLVHMYENQYDSLIALILCDSVAKYFKDHG